MDAPSQSPTLGKWLIPSLFASDGSMCHSLSSRRSCATIRVRSKHGPPQNQKANFREWVDPSLGAWPGNAVGKSWKRGACLGYQIRLDLVLKVSAQERWSCQWCD